MAADFDENIMEQCHQKSYVMLNIWLMYPFYVTFTKSQSNYYIITRFVYRRFNLCHDKSHVTNHMFEESKQ